MGLTCLHIVSCLISPVLTQFMPVIPFNLWNSENTSKISPMELNNSSKELLAYMWFFFIGNKGFLQYLFFSYCCSSVEWSWECYDPGPIIFPEGIKSHTKPLAVLQMHYVFTLPHDTIHTSFFLRKASFCTILFCTNLLLYTKSNQRLPHSTSLNWLSKA